MRIFKKTNESAIRIAFLAVFFILWTVALMPLASQAEPAHGIAMYGKPALPDGFTHLPYANPNARKGGMIRFAELGSYDSLKPWVLKGNPAWPLLTMPGVLAETLMLRSLDEPFALYGLLAESIETDPDRTWVEFTLRPEARFSDGSPVTVEDVMWSYETLGTKGHPRYLATWSKVKKMEQTGPNRIRFTFATKDRELALLMGLRPILKKAQWQGKDFTRSGMEVPIGSGPYVIAGANPGRDLILKKNPDWWGKDLPINQGLHNFDTIIYNYYGDNNAMFEAFKAGAIDVWRELDPANWISEYDFPRAQSGAIIKSEIQNQRPSGISGLVMNTRNPIFTDWRVRQALIEAFNWKFINTSLSSGAEKRISSYFANSELAMIPGAPAEGRVKDLLTPFTAELLPGTIEGYVLPEGSEQPYDRKTMRHALKLFEDAGWTVQNGVMTNANGQPFTFEILLNQSGGALTNASRMKQIAQIFSGTLRHLGIQATINLLDSAQYTERINDYEFDMTWYDRALSLSPGNEQFLYWGKAGVTQPGSRNWMGISSLPAEAMITEMLNTHSRENFISAVHALDRILTAGRYIIPTGYTPISRLAHDTKLKYPDINTVYGDYPGFLPETWWRE